MKTPALDSFFNKEKLFCMQFNYSCGEHALEKIIGSKLVINLNIV